MYTIIYNLSCKLHHRYSIAVVSVCVCSRIHTVIHIEPTNRTGGGNVSNNFHRWGGAMNERDASCSLIRVCYNRISIFFFIFGANICNCAYCCTDYLLFFFHCVSPCEHTRHNRNNRIHSSLYTSARNHRRCKTFDHTKSVSQKPGQNTCMRSFQFQPLIRKCS